jgi:menaquinone-9 beta-reductase
MLNDTSKLWNDYLAAWASRDVSRILSFFIDDATYEDVAAGLIHRGGAEIQAFVASSFSAIPDLAITLTTVFGGGIAGSTLATMLARQGRTVLVLERETKFKDRVRGENMLPWGVATARRLGVLEDLVGAGAHLVPFFNMYTMGTQTNHRPLPQTTPTADGALNMYQPDLQETLLARALKTGAHVKRGASVQGISQVNGKWTVDFLEGGRSQSAAARLVVGADGRSSRMRDWGGFSVNCDPEHLHIAGTIVEGTHVPDDGVHLCLGQGIATFIAPLGHKRARMYFIYVGAMGDRKLSGKERVAEFLKACQATGAPANWFDKVEVAGPLAEFEGADRSVPSPSKPGLALIGDAAAATDPSWGCGLSKTLVDVENLSRCLAETDDYDAALKRYAVEHDDYYGKLHNILSWMTELVWTSGPEPDERRARVFPRMQADPSGFPDPSDRGLSVPATSKPADSYWGKPETVGNSERSFDVKPPSRHFAVLVVRPLKSGVVASTMRAT